MKPDKIQLDEIDTARTLRQMEQYNGLLPDYMIHALCVEKGMISKDTYIGRQIKSNLYGDGIPSKGLSSVGYDVTLSNRFALFKTGIDTFGKTIDVRSFNQDAVEFIDCPAEFTLPPRGFVLGYTNEYFKMPNDVAAVALGKSTYARAGIAVTITPIEPGFEGNVVIEIQNQTEFPVTLFTDAGISQFMFHKIPRPVVTYGDRDGKYQGQTGLTLPRI